MNNTFRCDRCKKVMIGEEYDSHLCTPVPLDTKTIYIDYYRIIKDQLGRTVILTKGLNGIIYRLIKRDCKSSDKTLYPTKIYKPREPTETLQNLTPKYI